MKTQNHAEKIIVLGVDGMDPALTKKFITEGKLPNIKKLADRGAQREDLVMLGGHPTITPPMWTTLATGANPVTHGITDFWRQGEELDLMEYNLDSTLCKAEQLWNVFAEAGWKTLVWHWPGSSWPPTSDSPNLHVVDGVVPGGVNQSVASIDNEKMVIASEDFEAVLYKPMATHNESGAGCIITNLEIEEKVINDTEGNAMTIVLSGSKVVKNIILSHEDGECALEEAVFDIINSPIKEPTGWANCPEGAKEFTVITSNGLIRRPSLMLKNEKGEFDRIAIYKTKKDETPLIVVKEHEISQPVLDDIIVKDDTLHGSRQFKLLEISPDGSKLRLWLDTAMDVNNDTVFHPKSLLRELVQNVGYIPSIADGSNGGDPNWVEEIVLPFWERYTTYQAKALNYFIENDGYDVIFSHIHNVDILGHCFWYLAKAREEINNDETRFQKAIEAAYQDTDKYIGEFLHLLDKGWTILITSDHGLLVSEEHAPLLGDAFGTNVRILEELGFTVLKKDENGNDLKQIDWEKTTAVAPRGNSIYINVKGRDKHGIVDPGDQAAMETKVIDALYNYRDPHTGRRVVALALRNKDAAVLGVGGPGFGDILYWLEEGFNRVHGDSLSTYKGYFGSSVSPIFIAAGKGLKQSFTTDRIIKEVDFAPTIAALAGVRMPAQCEGAPVYQIIDTEI